MDVFDGPTSLVDCVRHFLSLRAIILASFSGGPIRVEAGWLPSRATTDAMLAFWTSYGQASSPSAARVRRSVGR